MYRNTAVLSLRQLIAGLRLQTTYARYMNTFKNVNKTVCSTTLNRSKEWEAKYRIRI